MSEQLVGRCPQLGHEIMGDAGQTPPLLRFTCQCPGRADGIYAVALGVAPLRAVHPASITPDHPGGQPGTLEHVHGIAAMPPEAAVLMSPTKMP